MSAVVLSWIIISITVYRIRNGKLRKENKLTSGNLSSRKMYMSAILAMLSNFFVLLWMCYPATIVTTSHVIIATHFVNFMIL